jgi:hypothetical protein
MQIEAVFELYHQNINRKLVDDQDIKNGNLKMIV